MTTLETPVARVSRFEYGVLHHSKRKRIVARFVPVDTIEFRELRGRRRFALPLDAAFRIAVRMTAEAARRARLEAKRNT